MSELDQAAEQVPGWVARRKQQGKSWRVLITVPDHALSAEMLNNLKNHDDLISAVWKGRTYADEAGNTMCMRPEAAELAAKYLLDTERAICGKPQDGTEQPERLCPFYFQCGYQRQKPLVDKADVIVAAHDILFHALPKEISHDLSNVIEDESWWQKGLATHQEIGIADLASKVHEFPPLRIDIDYAARATAYPPVSAADKEETDFARNTARFALTDKPLKQSLLGKKLPRVPRAKRGDPPRPKEIDPWAYEKLHNLCVRLIEALSTLTEQGAPITREACRIAGITSADAHDAVAWEWRRLVKPDIHAGMTVLEMRRAVAGAENNIQAKRRAGMWRALEDMLTGPYDACGRLQVMTVIKQDEEKRVIRFHEQKPLVAEILKLPNLYLDATPPAVEITRSYLPRYEQDEMITAPAPHQHLIQIIGPWTKTALLPEPKSPYVSAEENARRVAFCSFLRRNSGLRRLSR